MCGLKIKIVRVAALLILAGHVGAFTLVSDSRPEEPVPDAFVIAPPDVDRHIARASTESGVVFFTTIVVKKDGERELAMLRNFCAWLDGLGYLDNTMILTSWNTSWHAIRAKGLPVYLDRAFPTPAGYEDNFSSPRTQNRVFDLSKHWWGLQVIRSGRVAFYLDADAVMLRDPLEALGLLPSTAPEPVPTPGGGAGPAASPRRRAARAREPHAAEPYDAQGLSDWVTADIPGGEESSLRTCGNYLVVPDSAAPEGGLLCDRWHLPGEGEGGARRKLREADATGAAGGEGEPRGAGGRIGEGERAGVGERTGPGEAAYLDLPTSAWQPGRSLAREGRATFLERANPCQSTGVWVLRPTPAALAFSTSLVRRLLDARLEHQWEQTAWNDVVVAHLAGSGGVAGLAYRLLPSSIAANVNVYELRHGAGLPSTLAILHSGYLHGQEKADAYARLGVWHPGFNRSIARWAAGERLRDDRLRAGPAGTGHASGDAGVATPAPAASALAARRRRQRRQAPPRPMAPRVAAFLAGAAGAAWWLLARGRRPFRVVRCRLRTPSLLRRAAREVRLAR